MPWIYVWLGISFAAMIVELITCNMFAIWVMASGLVALVLASCSVAWYIQLIVFAVLTAVLILFVRRWINAGLKKLADKKKAKEEISEDKQEDNIEQ